MSTDGVEVSSAEIARIAGVKPTAVSNWRRRHDDFPRPVGGTDRSPRFDLAEVERWLADRDHATSIDSHQRLWQALDSARSSLPGDDLLSLVGLVLLHLDRHPGTPAPDRPGELSALLRAAGEDLTRLLPGPGVADLVRSAALPEPDARTVTLGGLAAATAREHGAHATLDRLATRLEQATQSGSHSVPPALADLVVRLADADRGTVVDPASGRGELLLAAARSGGERVLGQDRSPSAALVTALRLAFAVSADVSADVHAADALRNPVFARGGADAVVCAPPFGDRNWRAEESDTDPGRWAYGLPPRLESDLAWVQHCLAQARPGGRAVVLMPPGAAQRPSGRRIRRALLSGGTVRAVVSLPGGMAAHYAVPLQLWVLAVPEEGAVPAPVLFVDSAPPPHTASGGAPPGERQTLDWIARTWESFLADPAAFTGEPGRARAVEVADLLGEDVDLTPRIHLPLPRRRDADLADFHKRRDRLTAALRQLRGQLPAAPKLPSGAGGRVDVVSLGELAKAGSVTLRRPRAREDESLPTAEARVITGEDVLQGGTGSRTGTVDADPMRNPPIQEGDVLIPTVARRLTARVATAADAGAYPGTGVYVVRTNPAAVDPWFLAGFVTSTEEARGAARSSSSTRGHLRVDPTRLRLPVLPIEDQRRYGDLFRQVWRFQETLGEVRALGEALGAQAVDLIADHVRGGA
ncbi:N-6 DNA methylase [Nocardiopsis lucentensis]|uniref:N-6 DNA methylase n=1 Tax=Nocardiopsis lucentensis TaxID=53441 RepID=UPI000348EABA|nr:N-6 DNA methylase [Nocardiopsis lucentensis]